MGNAAAAFGIQNWLFICASPMSEDGIRIVGAISTLTRQASSEVIGFAVQQALLASGSIAPAATEQSWQASYKPMLDVTGFDNIRDLMLAGALVTCDDEGETLKFALAEKPSRGNVTTLPTREAMKPEGRQLIASAVDQLLAASLSARL